MRATARLGIALIACAACVTPGYVPRDGLLRHPRHPVAVPDLAAQGWERVPLDDADLAFQRDGAGVIAVRVRCPASRHPLQWESRGLWLGIDRGDEERSALEVDGHPAVETFAESGRLRVRTVLVRTPACSVAIAYVAPPGGEDLATFEGFIQGLRLGED